MIYNVNEIFAEKVHKVLLNNEMCEKTHLKMKRKQYIAPVTICKMSSNKRILKNAQKAKCKKKWIIGGHYIQKIKPRDGSKMLVWEYELIKFIYTINDYPMNSLIVKRISGPDEQIYTIGHNDCKRLHIKYQPGLQILSMNTINLKLKKC